MSTRTGWLPYLVSLAAYAALSVTHPLAMVDSGVLDQLSGTFSLSWWTAIPALLILILPLCKVPIRPTMAVSALTALLVTVFAQGRALLPTLRDAVLGYLPAPGALHDVLSGGGMMSMVSATIMAVSAGLYAGLLGGMGVLNGAAHLAQRLAPESPGGSRLRGDLRGVQHGILQPVHLRGGVQPAAGGRLHQARPRQGRDGP